MKAITCLLAIALISPLPAQAEDYALTLRDHLFEPGELVIPASTKVKLVVENKDATPEEFDSHDLNREKIIAGNGKAAIFIGPLTPGRYAFTGEFHSETAKGFIVVE